MIHNPANFNQITETIWIGNNMCCDMHNRKLIDLGFDADIDLEEQRGEEPPRTHIYLWLPTQDHAAPSPDQLSAGVASLENMTARKLKVYVHCKNGHGRAPTLVAAFFITQGMGIDEATATIKAQRPAIHLNETQIAALAAFAHRSRGRQ